MGRRLHVMEFFSRYRSIIWSTTTRDTSMFDTLV
jgi:hypothetical protein